MRAIPITRLLLACSLLAIALMCGMSPATHAAADADGSDADLPALWESQRRVALDTTEISPSSTGTRTTPEWGTRKSYLIPALEILGFDALLNQYDRHHYGCCDFHSNLNTIRRNLRGGWVVDSDGFTVNQIGHPYQGSMYHGFARARPA